MNQSASRIFIVDDDDGLRAALARLLRASGYNVESLSTPDDLLERADLTSQPACVVLDLLMPGMTGLEVQQKLAGLLPIVFLTGHGDVSSSVEAMKGGALDFLPKPVCEARLLAAVERALNRACIESRRRNERAEIEERMSHLTHREREVMDLVVNGRLNKQVASDLGASEKTIKIHRGRVMAKMKARTLVELVRIVAKARVCSTDEE
ncbi:response regulator transcription factor [Paraburkholderia youngii]|uniref:response regulator transcription factor n=1 Tax=Paraburkholderia youngii TaxID=2782701 RepID=UPI003D196BB9